VQKKQRGMLWPSVVSKLEPTRADVHSMIKVYSSQDRNDIDSRNLVMPPKHGHRLQQMRAVLQAGNRVSWGDGVMTKPEFISAELGTRVTAHALHIGDRINTMGFEEEALSAVPLAIRVGRTGVAVLFRYGVAVLFGLSPLDESGFLETLTPRIGGKLGRFEEETAIVALVSETEDQVQAVMNGYRYNRDCLRRLLSCKAR
jgi:uncharacterized Rmd1/YagE family protein